MISHCKKTSFYALLLLNLSYVTWRYLTCLWNESCPCCGQSCSHSTERSWVQMFNQFILLSFVNFRPYVVTHSFYINITFPPFQLSISWYGSYRGIDLSLSLLRTKHSGYPPCNIIYSFLCLKTFVRVRGHCYGCFVFIVLRQLWILHRRRACYFLFQVNQHILIFSFFFCSIFKEINDVLLTCAKIELQVSAVTVNVFLLRTELCIESFALHFRYWQARISLRGANTPKKPRPGVSWH